MESGVKPSDLSVATRRCRVSILRMTLWFITQLMPLWKLSFSTMKTWWDRPFMSGLSREFDDIDYDWLFWAVVLSSSWWACAQYCDSAGYQAGHPCRWTEASTSSSWVLILVIGLRHLTTAEAARLAVIVTSNVGESALTRNDALRREVQRLELELDRLRRRQWHDRGERRLRPSHGSSLRASRRREPQRPGQCWGAALAEQTGWTEFRANGLVALWAQSDSFHPELSLQQRLDRLVSGLGTTWSQPSVLDQLRQTTWRAFAFMAFERVNGWMKIQPGLCRICSNAFDVLAANSGRRAR